MMELILAYLLVGLGFMLAVASSEEGDNFSDGTVSGLVIAAFCVVLWPLMAFLSIKTRGGRYK